MNLIVNIKRIFVIILYLFTVVHTNKFISDSTNSSPLLSESIVTYGFVIVISILLVIIIYYNSKSDMFDVIRLLIIFILTVIMSSIIVDNSIVNITMNLLLSVMLSKYINIEVRDSTFLWMNMWTFFAYSTFIMFVFLGLLNGFLTMIFSVLMINILILEQEKIEKKPTFIKKYVRFEIMIFFIGINILFFAQNFLGRI